MRTCPPPAAPSTSVPPAVSGGPCQAATAPARAGLRLHALGGHGWTRVLILWDPRPRPAMAPRAPAPAASASVVGRRPPRARVGRSSCASGAGRHEASPAVGPRRRRVGRGAGGVASLLAACSGLPLETGSASGPHEASATSARAGRSQGRSRDGGFAASRAALGPAIEPPSAWDGSRAEARAALHAACHDGRASPGGPAGSAMQDPQGRPAPRADPARSNPQEARAARRRLAPGVHGASRSTEPLGASMHRHWVDDELGSGGDCPGPRPLCVFSPLPLDGLAVRRAARCVEGQVVPGRVCTRTTAQLSAPRPARPALHLRHRRVPAQRPGRLPGRPRGVHGRARSVGGVEVCDGIDNDCDGQTNEALASAPCELTEGVCAGAARACLGAAGWGGCDYGLTSRRRRASCDGLDGDCDGETDEGLAAAPCERTEASARGPAVPASAPRAGAVRLRAGFEQVEAACDGLDNDCDGATDEDLAGPACPLTAGVCAGASGTCAGAAGWSCDYGADHEPTELSCDGLDNDCDGQTDEELAGPACEKTSGVCARRHGAPARARRGGAAATYWGRLPAAGGRLRRAGQRLQRADRRDPGCRRSRPSSGTATPGLRDWPPPRRALRLAQVARARRQGNLYAADFHNHALRMIAPDGR
jgi:hypothetical protein